MLIIATIYHSLSQPLMTKIRSKLGLMELNLATRTMCERINESNYEYEGGGQRKSCKIQMLPDSAQTIKHIKVIHIYKIVKLTAVQAQV